MKEPLNLEFNANIRSKRFFNNIYLIMKQLVSSTIRWINMPEEIDIRYVEMTLLEKNQVLFFNDEGYKCLNFVGSGYLDIYNNPTTFQVYTPNGYFNDDLNYRNAVPIYGNFTRTPDFPVILQFANELTEIYMSMTTNLDLVNTPGLLTAPKDLQLTIENAVAQKKNGVPVILAKESFEQIEYKVFGVEGQKYFITDKLLQIYQAKWNEFLTYFGISNVQQQKRERLIVDEVMRAQGGCVAARNARLVPRMEACKRINEMFGLNISVEFRDVFEDYSIKNEMREGEENVELHDAT